MIKNSWQIRPLGELTDNYDYSRIPVKGVERRAGRYPYYGASGIIDFIDEYIFEGEYLLVAEDGENLKTRKTPIAFLANGKFWVNNHAHIIRGKYQIADTKFLMYSLINSDISGFLSGSTLPKLTQDNLKRIPILAPPLEEQRAIARILGTLDNKIELNRRMNETLEAIAHAIFKSWFVDFDPVRAKAEGREPAGMDAETAALFPDDFEETELGMVPKGWEAKLLGQTVCYINRGIQPKYIDDGGLKVINQKCIRNHQVDWTKARRHDPNFKPINDGRELQKGDILINSTGVGTLGRVAQILCLHEKVIVDSHVTIIRADSKIITWNVLGSMLIAQEAEIADLGEGTTGQTELSRERLKLLRVLVPSLDAQKMFDKATMPLRNLIQSNEMQNHALSEIRNSLLPKLLSGEVPAKVAGECL